MQHELATDPPPLTPDEEARDALNMAILREDELRNEAIIEEAKAPRFQGHPETCTCIRCAAAVLSSFTGKPVLFGAPLESSPRYQRILDQSHEGTEESAA